MDKTVNSSNEMADKNTIMNNRSTLAQALQAYDDLLRKLQVCGVPAADSTFTAVMKEMTSWKSLLEQSFRHARATDVFGKAAQRVFDIPELVEQILVHLNAFELLSALQINRMTTAAGRGSKSVREIMCIQPEPTSHWRTPFTRDTFPTSLADGRTTGKEGYNHNHSFKIVFRPDKALPTVGPLGRAMLICQPPIYEIDVTRILESLLMSLLSLLRRALCLGTSWTLQHTFVRSIGSVLGLKNDDPIVQTRYQQKRSRAKEYRRDKRAKKLLAPYLEAKRSALLGGSRIPTLAEFRANKTPSESADGGVERPPN
ncbi:hypothetical protein LTR08_001577 [Meristemomyces frigidus]|nr:hypothetical protein LTR08_001577 [Meristemomyces frigidus]